MNKYTLKIFASLTNLSMTSIIGSYIVVATLITAPQIHGIGWQIAATNNIVESEDKQSEDILLL